MMILWIASMFIGSLCMAQINTISKTGASGPFSNSIARGSSSFGPGMSGPFSSSSASGSSSVGPSGSSSFAQASTKIQPPPQPYPLCLKNKPADAITSDSPFTYSLLEASFTNPDLKGFYNTSFDTTSFYGAFYDELKETWTGRKSQLLAGSLSSTFQRAYPQITPLLNAVSIVNAIGEYLGDDTIVISEEKEDYIQPFLSAISKAVSEADGSAVAQTRAVAKGLLKYMDDIQELSYSNLHEFASILDGEYRLATFSTCKPSNFVDIPKL